jgi:salicylate hydroxylase
MAFYLSMGVSMAVEDAEALTECLALVQKGYTTLDQAISIFETVRKPRAEAVKAASLHAGKILQLPPGPTRDSRNLALKSDGASIGIVEDERFYETKSSFGIGDKLIRDWCYSYDAVEAVKKEWQRVQTAP